MENPVKICDKLESLVLINSTYKIDTRKINVVGDFVGGNLGMLAEYSMGDETLPP